ncbi:aldehyde dehydrogenase family protein [Janthinobacterium sp. UMAB-56]|uniref:aldehyde dehydrogenase family protein n=1 Tax=Janthinobacterium sp. UMAB-56 TaxID=1365361 RepID=UPI001C59EB02|nr:aldehyde dehydrogenase family protein [Janthinobacterium sp. UMAB-56]
MQNIHHIYINGQFVTPHGTQVQELINPTTGQPRASVVLGDETDVHAAVAAAKAAYPAYSRTSKQERMAILQRMHDAVAARSEELVQVMVEEYGGTLPFCRASVQRAANSFLHTMQLLETFDFVRTAGSARVVLEPLGVVGIITPWNSSYGFICSKLATALAAGSTAVIKPSELSAAQTQILTECLHAAQIAPGLFNIVNGSGDTVGAAITAHRDIAKISFTGSTAVGKQIARGAVETMKRVTLELGGKSPNVLLEDADLDLAIPTAVAAFTFNSGQACLAGTRLIVPASRLDEIQQRIKVAVDALIVGAPADAGTQIGPLVNAAQHARVQRYIALGTQEGATLLTGGTGHPPGMENGYFVKPTVFVNVRNDMAIAQEEIFGPVLSIIAYDSEEEAIAIANDTRYGLQAYVSSRDQARANRVAAQLVAGRVFINGLYDEPLAPFGGFKQSGIGREFGTYGLEAYLEPKAMMGYSTSHESP